MQNAKLLLVIIIISIFGFLGWKTYFTPADPDTGLSLADAGLEGEREDDPLVAASRLMAQATVGAKQPTAPQASASIKSEIPVRIEIPKLGINAKVIQVGITAKGNMGAPSNFSDVGWYNKGTIPGRVGSAVLSGHEDNAAGLNGVFKRLGELSPGDDIYIVRADGKRLHFKVETEAVYPYNLKGAELTRIFAAKDAKRLNLITCTGEWVDAIKTNDKRLVTYAKLVE